MNITDMSIAQKNYVTGKFAFLLLVQHGVLYHEL